jgi:chromosome segregation ATPase
VLSALLGTAHAALRTPPSSHKHLHRGAFLTVQSTHAASGGELRAEIQMETEAWHDALLDAEEVNRQAGSLLTDAALNRVAGFHQGPTQKLKATANKTALKSELSLLKGLFSRLKRGIVNSKKQEEKDKERQQQTLKVLQDRLQTAQNDLGAAKKSPKTTEFRMSLLKERVEGLQRSLQYWKEERETSHVEFHAALKTSHGLMSRVQTAVKVYEDALGGKAVKTETLTGLGKLPTPKEALTQLEAGLAKCRKRASSMTKHND